MSDGSNDAVATAVAAYARSMDVPDVDLRAVASRRRPQRIRPAVGRRRVVMAVVACIALFVLVDRRGVVVARVEHFFAAFSMVAGRPTPLNVRDVDFSVARANAPFALIEPPAVDGARPARIREISAASGPVTSVVFEYRATSLARGVTIVERAVGSAASDVPSLLTIGATNDGPALPSTAFPHRSAAIVLRGVVAGRPFAPVSWTARGTRVDVLGPPGAMTAARVGAIRRAMSR